MLVGRPWRAPTVDHARLLPGGGFGSANPGLEMSISLTDPNLIDTYPAWAQATSNTTYQARAWVRPHGEM